MTKWVQRKLSRKLFLSYLVVVGAGMAVLALTAELSAPSAFERHMSSMAMVMGGPVLHNDLFESFRRAVSEALLFGVLTSALIATIASLLFGHQVTTPLRNLMYATQRIADGHYDERVLVPEPPAGDELAELARSFNRMAQALAQGETLRRDLIGNVAHELRTPLATIKGHMEGLLDGVLPPEPATYELIYREATRLERLVNDLQELSRVEAGAYELNRQMVTLAELAHVVVGRLELQFQEKGVILDNQVPAGLPPVWVDPDRIGQVLLNLVGNALQYTPAGGRVTLSARQEAGRLLFIVADAGIGIAPEHLPHIFTRFYRVDRSRSRSGGGSGIGLTIARLLAEAHGGSIRAESAGLGKGSTFTLVLPIGP